MIPLFLVKEKLRQKVGVLFLLLKHTFKTEQEKELTEVKGQALGLLVLPS